MSEQTPDPGNENAEWIWDTCVDMPQAERLALVDLFFTDGVEAPEATAQWLLGRAIAVGDQELVALLVRRGGRVKGTLFENLVHPDTLELHPKSPERERSGPFNLPESELAALRMPGEAEWRSIGWDFDTPYAYENFNGLSIAQASDRIDDKGTYVCEDFFHMPDPCFRFYVLAYVEYLVSPRSQLDSDASSSFITYVSHNLKAIVAGNAFLRSRIDLALSMLGSSQEWFDATRTIYGDFAARAGGIVWPA